MASLQLGTGGYSAYASFNPFSYNLLRDGAILVTAHLLWALQCSVLMFSLSGLAATVLPAPGSGQDLAGLTVLETGLASLPHSWVWLGLGYILLIISTTMSTLGYVTAITASIRRQKTIPANHTELKAAIAGSDPGSSLLSA